MKIVCPIPPPSEKRKNEYLGSESEISLASPAASVELVPASSIFSVATSILYAMSASYLSNHQHPRPAQDLRHA